MKPLRTAIYGCGTFAHRHAANLVTLPEEIELVAFCDRNPPKTQHFTEKYTAGRARTYTSYAEMLARETLDLVAICLPPFGHTDEVELAAARGIHIFIEKPIALTSEQAWRMVAACERAGIKTQVGFMFRFGEAIERLKGLIESGESGPVGLMAARYFCNALHAYWWRDRQKSGGQLVEQVIHMVDLMRYLLGEPLTVYSKQANLFHTEMPDYTVEDVSATVFGFPSGALGVIYASNGAIPNRWINDYRIVAHKLTAEFSNANNATFHFTGGPEVVTETIASQRNMHLREFLDLIAAIRHGGETRTPMAEGARSLDLALAAVRSAQAGQEVRCEGRAE